MEVSCYAYEGIDAVKEALKAGLQQSTEEMPLEIRLIAPPQYVITTTTLDRTEGVAKLNTTIQARTSSSPVPPARCHPPGVSLSVCTGHQRNN